jgi:hypothetical protein
VEELDYWLAAEPFPKAIMGDERSHLGGASQHAIGNVIAAPTCCPTAESFAIALLLGFASGRPLLIRNQSVRLAGRVKSVRLSQSSVDPECAPRPR